ncbi:GAF domain-containing protein [Luteolibacter sp. AS25]|uniref:GAF domain-containing protein n=1 Tax=Luteolibacter sp. AS25 TaxID=3135776 RepID=UPI00398BB704
MKEVKERLAEVLAMFDCRTGTLHAAKCESLTLVSAIGVPDFLLEKIQNIPFGKGIAGVAAESKGPVELCNLQQDLGGIAKENARATGVAGSLAVPIFSADGMEVIGVLGIGKTEPYDFTDQEKALLGQEGEKIRAFLSEFIEKL